MTIITPVAKGQRPKTYSTGRVCECGTILSRYNPADKCATCAPPTQLVRPKERVEALEDLMAEA